MITATGLGLVGDMISQHIIEEKPLSEHDFIRSVRFAAFGPLIWVPISSRWILYAEKAFPIPPILNLFKKVAIDQLLLGSLIALIAFHYNERKCSPILKSNIETMCYSYERPLTTRCS